ncbi:MAG: hypothetical protein BZY88_16245 [SAR202 cluster bacterium Io17-Chloro-G9]|nr:MAG: hypothetical protein BZY88_16245 [SAR202 cluster bacterium Io17-Chloro-G9]
MNRISAQSQFPFFKGDPDKAHTSTSYAELPNFTMRMSMRRLARLTNGFSKKLQNHMYAIALYFMHYIFASSHRNLKNPYRRTPAMATGLTDRIGETEELLSLRDRSI